MKAYLQIDLKVIDPGFMEYATRIPALIEKHGGRYLVQGVTPVAVQSSSAAPEHSVILEFPSEADARAFLAERESSDLHQIWHKTTEARILLLVGCT